MHIEVLTSKDWQSKIEPIVAQWVQAAGHSLRRHRAGIGPWILELVCENERTLQLFSQHWTAASLNQPPDAYCYLVPYRANGLGVEKKRSLGAIGSIPEGIVCAENGRALACDADPYTVVNGVCDALITVLATARTRAAKSAGRRRPAQNWWILPATCIEYQTATGDTRSVALLGDGDSQRIIHGYSLALCKSENGFVSDCMTAAQVDSLSVFRAKSKLWWPTSLVHPFRHLLPHLVMNPLEGVPLDAAMVQSLRAYRNGLDLARAIEGGSFPEEQCARLVELLERSEGGRALIDPRDLLGVDRCIDQSQLTDLVRCQCDLGSDWIMREASRDVFIASSSGDFDQLGGELASSALQLHRDCLTQWFGTGRVRATLLNLRLPTAQIQFCLRHFLEGLSDSVQLLSPESFHDASVIQSMRIERRSAAAWEAEADSFVHGLRRVQLVGFTRRGQFTECVAFDPAVNGYAQVRSVWPGQVADFFTRHVDLHARELFTQSGPSAPIL